MTKPVYQPDPEGFDLLDEPRSGLPCWLDVRKCPVIANGLWGVIVAGGFCILLQTGMVLGAAFAGL